MKAWWLHGLALALLLGLSPPTAQASPAAAVPAGCEGAVSPGSCCEDCDDVAAQGACTFVCASQCGLTRAAMVVAIPVLEAAAPSWAGRPVHRAIAPDPHPPKAAVVI